MQMAGFWLSGFFVFCLFFLLDEFVILWLGEEFVFDFLTKVTILASLYLTIILYPIVAFREATGMYQKTKYAMVTAAALKIMLSVVLGIYMDLPGIILATIVSRLMTYAWYEPRVLFRDFLGGRGARRYLLGNLLNAAMLAGCIVAVFFLITLPEINGWSGWLIRGIACAAFINLLYFARYIKTPEFRFAADKLKGLLKRRSL
jgi:hypothetical protein